jgi:hypothetical protein
MAKDIIIDGDKFQKEYKKQYKKEVIYEIILGILLILIAISGLFFGSKLLLKIGIYIFPILIIGYGINLLTISLSLIRRFPKQASSFLIQAVLAFLIAFYIIFNPIETLSYILIIFGAFMVINSIIKILLLKNRLPITTLLIGLILMLFSNELINIMYYFVMVLLLIIGTILITSSYYKIKNK